MRWHALLCMALAGSAACHPRLEAARDDGSRGVIDVKDRPSLNDAARLEPSRLDLTLTSTGAPPSFAGIADLRSVPETPVALPPAGSSFVDPDFGTTIIRATDARQAGAAMCTHSYSYVPAFNIDSTRLLLSCDGLRLYRFDPATDTLVDDGTLVDDQSLSLNWQSAYWSGTSPDHVYVLGGPLGQPSTRLYVVDVTRHDVGRLALVHDFAGLWPGSWDLWQLGRSEDDNLFTFHARGAGSRKAGAYLRESDMALTFPDADFETDETQVDKAGRYVGVVGRGADEYRVAFWDVRAGGVAFTLGPAAEHRVGGHYDLGSQLMVNGDRYQTGIVRRDWTAPEQPRNILRYTLGDGATANWTIADHLSMRNADESFLVASTYGPCDPSWPPFQREIIVVRTNGSAFHRVAHTRSTQTADDYWSEPRASVDHLGRYVVFASDYGSSQIDVFILKLPRND